MLSDFINQVICGDSREVLKQIPDESIDLVLTDPPYGINKKDIIGDENINMYIETLEELHRVLKIDSWYITFLPIGDLTFTIKTQEYFRFVWYYIIYYANMQRITHAPVGYAKYSLVGVFAKGKPKPHIKIPDVYRFVYNETNKSDRFQANHPSPKLVQTLYRLIRFATNEENIILDPFLGSGTTAIAAIRNNRNFIGIEISEKYCEIARKRIEKARQSKSYKLTEYQ